MLLVAVGIAFLVTACAYGVMAYRDVAFSAAGQPRDDSGYSRWMDQHGITALAVEVALLGLFTLGAISTDSYWQRHGPSGQPRSAEQEREDA